MFGSFVAPSISLQSSDQSINHWLWTVTFSMPRPHKPRSLSPSVSRKEMVSYLQSTGEAIVVAPRCIIRISKRIPKILLNLNKIKQIIKIVILFRYMCLYVRNDVHLIRYVYVLGTLADVCFFCFHSCLFCFVYLTSFLLIECYFTEKMPRSCYNNVLLLLLLFSFFYY